MNSATRVGIWGMLEGSSGGVGSNPTFQGPLNQGVLFELSGQSAPGDSLGWAWAGPPKTMIKSYLNPEEPTFLGFLIMIYLYKSLQR